MLRGKKYVRNLNSYYIENSLFSSFIQWNKLNIKAYTQINYRLIDIDKINGFLPL